MDREEAKAHNPFVRASWIIAFVFACSQSESAGDAGVDACAVTNVAQWSEADALFQNDSQWIGADAAYSVDLGGGRILWLFGDSFIAKDASRSRSNAWFVRNSVAIQTGSSDPSSSSAHATFSWRTTNGAATSFVPESGANWFWPLAGVRLESRLVLFFLEEAQTGSGSFGFQAVGTHVFFVDNPDDDPLAWNLVDGNLPTFSFPIAFGAGVVRDGDAVYAFGDEEPGDHSVYVARFDEAALDSGDASSPRFFAGGAWSTTIPTSAPDTIFPSASSLDNPPTEMSVQKLADGTWLATHSIGFGATSIAVRTAPAPEGPWTSPCVVFTPLDSETPNVIVYAAKAHPELTGGSFIATYATNSTDSATLVSDMSVYFPRFVRAN